MNKLLMMTVILFLLTACGLHKNSSIETETTDSGLKTEQTTNGQTTTNLQNKEPMVNIEEVPYAYHEVEKYGQKRVEITYTNNSQYSITKFDLVMTKKNSDEMYYFSSTDTVMPGEISPKFFNVGSTEMEPLSLSLHVYQDGKKYDVSYDYISNVVDVNEVTFEIIQPTTEPLVTIDEVPYEYRETDEYGQNELVMSYTNNSQYPIVNFTSIMLDRDSNEKLYFSTKGMVMPGDASPKFIQGMMEGLLVPPVVSSPCQSLEPLKLNIGVIKDGKKYSVTYDYKLKIYGMYEIMP